MTEDYLKVNERYGDLAPDWIVCAVSPREIVMRDRRNVAFIFRKEDGTGWRAEINKEDFSKPKERPPNASESKALAAILDRFHRLQNEAA